MKTKLTLTLITLAGLILFASYIGAGIRQPRRLWTTKSTRTTKAAHHSILPERDQTWLVAERFRKTSSSVLRARG